MVLDGLNNYSSLLQHKKRKFLSNFGKTNFVPGPFSANLFDGISRFIRCNFLYEYIGSKVISPGGSSLE